MKRFKQLFALLLALMTFAACAGCEKTLDDSDATKLSFQAASGYDYLKSLDGTKVSINGYIATSSPVDGSFIFLMNLPYQNCPFCIPNTTQLSNTMEVYPKKGESFSYTAQAVKVVGTLIVAEDPDKPFTDMYGYQFNFKIVDADYAVIDADELSEDMALWQEIAQSDVVSDIYTMYDYVGFLCTWNTYKVNSATDANGNVIPGYYLYPTDALQLITTPGAQYNYGYQEDYFDNIIKKIETADPEAFADLVDNVRKAELLAAKAFGELKNENYSAKKMHLEEFGTEDFVYTLYLGEELTAELNTLYADFVNWIASWEM